jgi:hypothetical protein
MSPGVKVRLEFLDQDFRNGTAQLMVWIERSIAIVAGYYGRFPTAELRLQVHSTGGSGVRHGTAFGSSTPRIRLQVGREATAAELMWDWVLVHEMVHLALPEVGRKHAWLSEGLATYVEGIARVQAGNRSAKDVWAEYVHSMPQGLPRSGDEGLDNTHTWDERTGAARCSVCRQMWRSGSGRTTASACRTRCARLRSRAAVSALIGPLSAYLPPVTRR